MATTIRKSRKQTLAAPIAQPAAPELSAEQVAANAAALVAQATQRRDELVTARKKYLTATLGARAGGGSDLVGRALRALKLIDGGDFVDMDDLIKALNSVDGAALNTWGTTYVAGLVQSKGNLRRIAAFGEFIAADGFKSLAFALSTFRAHRAWNFSETIKNPKSGHAMTFTVDVVRELNDMFALKATNSRRARWGAIG